MYIKKLVRDKQYSQIGNVLLRDKTITYECKGFLCELLSHRNDFNVIKQSMIRSVCGRDKLNRIIGEAKAAGYLFVVAVIGSNRRYRKRFWFVSEERVSLEDIQEQLKTYSAHDGVTYVLISKTGSPTFVESTLLSNTNKYNNTKTHSK